MATTTEESSPVLAQADTQKPDLELSPEPSSGPIPEQNHNQTQTPFLRRGDREEEEDDEDDGGQSTPGPEAVGRDVLDLDWVEERFRIDRKKLENMLYGE